MGVDVNNWIDIVLSVFTKILLYPFLVVFGAGSRISYDYYVNKKKPPRGQVFAILLLSAFVSTIVYLVADAYGVSPKYKVILVALFAFVGHTALTYILENQDELFSRLLAAFGLKKKKTESDDNENDN